MDFYDAVESEQRQDMRKQSTGSTRNDESGLVLVAGQRSENLDLGPLVLRAHELH